MNIKIFNMLLLLALSNNSFAGAYGLTMHSRANCGNNESITWHLGHTYVLKTISVHKRYDRNGYAGHHVIETPWKETWRSAAVCWNEAYSGYIVQGYHYIRDGKGKRLLGTTYAKDCNIYNGWWDR